MVSNPRALSELLSGRPLVSDEEAAGLSDNAEIVLSELRAGAAWGNPAWSPEDLAANIVITPTAVRRAIRELREAGYNVCASAGGDTFHLGRHSVHART